MTGRLIRGGHLIEVLTEFLRIVSSLEIGSGRGLF